MAVLLASPETNGGALGAETLDASDLTRYVTVALAALFFGAMVSGVINPWARPRPGREVMQLRTSFRARILLNRWYLLLILGIFLGIRLLPGTWTTEGADVVSLLLVAGWLLFPVSYYFTDQGRQPAHGSLLAMGEL